MRGSRPRAGRAGAAIVGVLVALALLEIVVRLAIAPSPAQVLRGLHRATPDRPWLYELVPGEERRDASSPDVVYTINEAGFRDRSYPRTKPEDTFRVALIGDSVSFGYGVALDATFAKQLEGRLRSLVTGPRYEVLNLGVSGYNPYTEAELLRGVGLAYEPDLVLVQFCINDLNDPTLHFDTSTMLALGDVPAAAFPDPDARTARPAPLRDGRVTRLCDRSRLCSTLAGVLAPATANEDLVAALAPHEAPSPAEIAWLERSYARMAEDTSARGGTLAVVVFPWETQLAADASATLQEQLRALGERAGFLVIDLLPAFRRAAAEAGEPLFLDLWHPTQRGHQVAAQEIFRALACARLLPAVTARCDP